MPAARALLSPGSLGTPPALAGRRPLCRSPTSAPAAACRAARPPAPNPINPWPVNTQAHWCVHHVGMMPGCSAQVGPSRKGPVAVGGDSSIALAHPCDAGGLHLLDGRAAGHHLVPILLAVVQRVPGRDHALLHAQPLFSRPSAHPVMQVPSVSLYALVGPFKAYLLKKPRHPPARQHIKSSHFCLPRGLLACPSGGSFYSVCSATGPSLGTDIV